MRALAWLREEVEFPMPRWWWGVLIFVGLRTLIDGIVTVVGWLT